VWGDFWNAASAVIRNPMGAFFSVVGEVFTLAVAAGNLFTHLAHEAAAVGGTLLKRVAGTLVEIGRVIDAALVQFLNYITMLITQAIDAAMAPITSALLSYASAVNSAVDPSGSPAVWGAVGGPAFELGFGAALVLEVVLTFVMLISDFSPASVLVGALVGVITTAVSAGIPLLSSMSTSLVSSCESWAGDSWSQSSVSAEWTSMTNAFTYWVNGPVDQWAGAQLTFAWSVPAVAQAASFAFAIASLAMTFDAGRGGGLVASVSATVLAGVSCLLEVKAAAAPLDKAESSLGVIDALIGALDVSCFTWDAATLHTGN
jgi:hypothetical protein